MSDELKLLIAFVIVAIVAFMLGLTYRRTGKDAAKLVKHAFDGGDWQRYTFTINGGAYIEAPGGEKFFYKAGEIDAAIKRLNEVLNELNKD